MRFLVLILFIFLVIVFVTSYIDFKKSYKKFVIFLQKENDLETLNQIGARSFNTNLNYPNKVFFHTMKEHLQKMHEESGKIEYKDYLEEVESTKITLIVLPIIIFLLGCYLWVKLL